MSNPPKELDRFHKSISSLGGTIAVAILLFSLIDKEPWIPGCVLFILVVHFLIFIVYLWLPWRGWEWPAKEEATKKELRKICKGIHLVILLALFISPMICVGMAFGVKYFPTYVDEEFVQSFADISRTNSPSLDYAQASFNAVNTITATNSFIGMTGGRQAIMLLPTQKMVEDIIKPLPFTYAHHWGHVIAFGIAVGILGLLLLEKIMRVQNEKR
jgi:hypothetical protein